MKSIDGDRCVVPSTVAAELLDSTGLVVQGLICYCSILTTQNLNNSNSFVIITKETQFYVPDIRASEYAWSDKQMRRMRFIVFLGSD